ncbi:ABC transporter ATP-binding protein [Acidihalobacter ferrooxydans]|uniref:Sugar ABC transporter ATP-binding protein n=1 Tax=Acidihalobacter ferrooxydans TaxID=1765967 RepID=A0A1P8UKC8_9GAMM|nr:sn-glycerol-3-phosphate ABC transporter ATP-binding protein UgpC [Acidihalobacter ferrooxydans]APZ44212.1 sugar ABC transporter ATP-binding protein [Acidihalobacter ferrooxydans]
MGKLSIRNVHKTFGDNVEVLKGINIETSNDQFLILVGPSGCGKSTLLNIIAGLEEPTGGDIFINERRVNERSPRDRDIAMVFQSYALYPSMTVRKNILFGLRIRKVPKDEQDHILKEVATMLQIEHLLDRKPRELSGGQRQRVAIGRAIARKPALFLFDEPLSNLDAKLRVEMRDELKRLHQRMATTIVYVTHDQIEAMTLGDLIAVMNDGQIQQLGTPQEIYDNPANLFVAGFIGSPSMNFIPCTVTVDAQGAALEMQESGQRFTLLAPAHAQAPLRERQGQQVILGVRPEQITHKSVSQLDEADTRQVTATVDIIEPTGPDTLVFIHLNDTKIVCRVHPPEAKQPGERMELLFDLAKAVFFDPTTEHRIA